MQNTLLAVLAGVLLPATAVLAQQRLNPIVFQDVIGPAGVEIHSPVDQHAAVLRSRAVRINVHELSPVRAGDGIILNLFDDVALQVVVDRARQSSVETVHWSGHVANNPQSSVYLVLHRHALAGIIRVPSVGDFRIRSSADRGLIVEEIEATQLPRCGTGPAQVVAHPQNDGLEDASTLGPIVCPSFVDVMIVYTPEARDLEGGTDPVVALAYLAVDEANGMFINSQIDTRLNLVHVAEIDYVETGVFGTELNRLRGTADGFMDSVHALRDEHGADIVSLLISHTEGGTICGIAYLMVTVGPAFEADAFNVCNTGCTLGGYTFSHEVGHNMGCAHDRDNAGGPGAFSYSYGYRFIGDDDVEYRTVMAYAPGARIPYFSNPNITYQGQPIGLPEGDTNSADNARTINETAPTVIGFRAPSPLAFGPASGPQSWTLPEQITPSDVAAGDRFGTSVALHGELMIVGSYLADGTLADTGAAYVYRKDTTLGTWVQEGKLTADDAAFNDRLGVAVDVYDDGNGGGWAAVGAYLDDDGGRDSGAVYIYRRTSMTWAQEEKLTASDMGPGDLFGNSLSVATTPEGEFILIGAYLHEEPGFLNRGAAYVFHKVESTWTEVAKLQANDALNQDQFGFSVALAATPVDNALTALIGAWRDDEDALDTGSAYVFSRAIEGGWTQTAKLVHANRQQNDQFGYAVSLDITDQARMAVVSAWTVDGPASNTGAAFVFSQALPPPPPPKEGESDLGPTPVSWLQEAKLVASDPFLNDRFGSSVAISGEAVIVGAYQNDETEDDVGAAYVFRKRGLGWVQEARLIHDTPAFDDEFGFCVAMHNNRAVVGAWGRDVNTLELAGAIYVIEGEPITDCNENGISDECDIASGTSQDVDVNGIPDECDKVPNPCPADIGPPGGDGVVGVPDLLALINAWGPCVGCPEDIAPPGGDGVVGVPDLLALINGWGPCLP